MKHLIKIISIMMIIVVSAFMMFGCGSEGAATVPSDQDVQTEALQHDQQQESQVINDSDVDEKKVKEIVLAKVPGAVESSIYELEKEYDDGRLEYEGSLYHDGYEYEFEIDGATGEILQWEIDD